MPRLNGKRIVLREYRESDLSSIRRWVNDPTTVQHLSDIFLYPQSEKQSREFLEMAMSSKWNGFVIAHKETQEYIGQIDFVKMDQKNGWGELGMVIGDESHRGLGFGREALHLFLRFGFEQLRLHRIELVCWHNNIAGQRAYEAVGFVNEGTRRGKWYRDGDYQDEVCYGLLRDEYLARQSGTP